MKRGDVVVAPFRYQNRPGQKIRPAVVVQSDAENRRLANTILAMITGHLADGGRPTTPPVAWGRSPFLTREGGWRQ